MIDAPYLTKLEMHAWARREGLAEQRLYTLGMPHANCGGFCVKAGIGHFARLLAAMPGRYREHEAREEALRLDLGNVAILRDRSQGVTTPLTLRVLRERIEADWQPDLFDLGGCGCFVDVEEAVGDLASPVAPKC